MEATAVAGANEREARRKRIVERGSDRMALITGRIQTLSSPTPSSKHSHTQSSPAVFFEDQSLSSDQFHGHPGLGSDTSKIHDMNDEYSSGNAFKFGSRVEPQFRKCETNIGAIKGTDVDVNKIQPLATPNAPKAFIDAELLSKVFGSHPFTAKEINSCIIASESTRVFCSLIIAMLVVLSNMSHPHSVANSKSSIASRPLYILLLTDVTIVLVRLLEQRRISEKTEEEEKVGQKEDGVNWVGAITILEMSLAFYQAIRGLFIDCSFYLVVIVCGISLI